MQQDFVLLSKSLESLTKELKVVSSQLQPISRSLKCLPQTFYMKVNCGSRRRETHLWLPFHVALLGAFCNASSIGQQERWQVHGFASFIYSLPQWGPAVRQRREADIDDNGQVNTFLRGEINPFESCPNQCNYWLNCFTLIYWMLGTWGKEKEMMRWCGSRCFWPFQCDKGSIGLELLLRRLLYSYPSLMMSLQKGKNWVIWGQPSCKV